MKNRYDRVMKKLEVTPEMQDRILNHINHLDWDKAPIKVVPFHNYKKYLSIAACLTILLVGSIIIHNTSNVLDESPIQMESDIVEFGSLEELSEGVGFTVNEIQEVPFEVEAVKYTSFWGEFAEIEYQGKNNTLTLRMAARSGDVSGDYSEYADIENHRINDYDITMKGNDGRYCLAVWEQEGYSYSVRITNGISEAELLEIVQSVE